MIFLNTKGVDMSDNEEVFPTNEELAARREAARERKRILEDNRLTGQDAADWAMFGRGDDVPSERWALKLLDEETSRYWSSKASWSIAEACFLLSGIAPLKKIGDLRLPLIGIGSYDESWFLDEQADGLLLPVACVGGVDTFNAKSIIQSAKRGKIGGEWLPVWEKLLYGN